MRRSIKLSTLLAALLFVHIYGYCDITKHVVEVMEKGSINWTKGVFQAKGTGLPSEKKTAKNSLSPMDAARENALGNLYDVIKRVRIDSRKTVGDLIQDNNAIEAEVLNMINHAKLVEPIKYLSDRSVEVTVEMNLNGGFSQLILPREIKHVESIKTVKPVQQSSVSDIGKAPPAAIPQNSAMVYTGLIVDARGLKVKPAMVPIIMDEDKREIYGPAFVSRESVVQAGMVGYKKDLDSALECKRVAKNPLIVKGLKTTDSARSDIVILNCDASKIRSASEHLSFMKKCRVVIVID